MINVLVVDDHPAICFAVKGLLEQQEGYQVHSAKDGITALSILKTKEIDLIILDISLTKMDGLELISRVLHLDKHAKVIVFTGQPVELYAERMLRAGAISFLSKDDDIRRLASICELTLSGYSVFPTLCLEKRHSASSEETIDDDTIDKLSDRELTVLRHLAVGLSNKEIADKLLLSNKTISTYKARLMEKLHINNMEDIPAQLLQKLNKDS